MKQNRLHDFIIIDIWSLITVLNNVSYRLVDEETKINNIWLTSSLVAYGIAIKVAILSVWNFRQNFSQQNKHTPFFYTPSALGYLWYFYLTSKSKASSASELNASKLSAAPNSVPMLSHRLCFLGPVATSGFPYMDRTLWHMNEQKDWQTAKASNALWLTKHIIWLSRRSALYSRSSVI